MVSCVLKLYNWLGAEVINLKISLQAHNSVLQYHIPALVFTKFQNKLLQYIGHWIVHIKNQLKQCIWIPTVEIIWYQIMSFELWDWTWKFFNLRQYFALWKLQNRIVGDIFYVTQWIGSLYLNTHLRFYISTLVLRHMQSLYEIYSVRKWARHIYITSF